MGSCGPWPDFRPSCDEALLAAPADQTWRPVFGRHTYWIRIQLSLLIDLDSDRELDLAVVSGPPWDDGDRPPFAHPAMSKVQTGQWP